MRQQGIDSGLIQEAKISRKPYKDDKWLLINSLSCHPITQIDDINLTLFENPRNFWFMLLKDN